jgi:hypothetical protein
MNLMIITLTKVHYHAEILYVNDLFLTLFLFFLHSLTFPKK